MDTLLGEVEATVVFIKRARGYPANSLLVATADVFGLNEGIQGFDGTPRDADLDDLPLPV